MSLIQKLIAWQQDTARKSHLEPYMILQFNTIKEIVRLEPKQLMNFCVLRALAL